MNLFSPTVAAVCLGLLHIIVPARADDIFTFSGFTFDQRNTPDRGARLGDSQNLGGAQFSSGFASSTTINPINFPQGGTGFNTNLSLAQLSGLRAGLYAVNLPNGNQGATNRHGIEVRWSNNRAIPNMAGTDFVVYESASSISGVEGVMARVRTNHVADLWSDWFYFASTNFQITSGTEGIHSYGFDLSAMGVPENASIDRIQLANLMQADRIVGPGTNVNGSLIGQGKVIFDGSTEVLPDAGSYDGNRLFDATQLDPDPLYVASLRVACELSAPLLNIARTGTNMLLTWPSPSCFSPQSATNLLASNTLWTAAGGSIFVTNELNAVIISGTHSARFFRLVR
ncbi:MAG: hypothetical protein H0X66_00755 [Verrucomicrobia bacterium]|nr:hypothetical protein [Verrucomicrobiota bacterium]